MKISSSFRPLIRGFFFYGPQHQIKPRGIRRVSVPLFGDSFFIQEAQERKQILESFRPLIRGFFFYKSGKNETSALCNVSVPLFGDSFFMNTLR